MKINPTHTNETKPAVLILAGGLSERMDFPKPWLPFNKNQTFLEKIVKEYFRFGCRQMIVVINEAYCDAQQELHLNDLAKYAKIILNKHPKKGKSYSIYSGMKKISDCPYLFVQNIDNPFIDLELLTAIYQSRNEDGYTVPVFENKGGHPILIGKQIIEELRNVNPESFNLRELLNDYHRTEIEYSKSEILANINTQEDYNSFFNEDYSFRAV